MMLDVGLIILEKATITALPLLLSVFTGMPMEWVLPASIGIVALKEMLSYSIGQSRLKRNGLSFLLDIG